MSPSDDRDRITEIGSPQGFTFFARPTPDDGFYLGSPTDVEDIVRAFCMDVFELRTAFGKGTVSGPEALARLNQLAADRAAIFYGQEPETYRPMPFNCAAGLGNFINQRLGMNEPPEQAAHTLFMSCANQILAAYEAHQSGAMADDDVQFQLQAAIDDASRILLGLPPEDAD